MTVFAVSDADTLPLGGAGAILTGRFLGGCCDDGTDGDGRRVRVREAVVDLLLVDVGDVVTDVPTDCD